MFDGCWSIIQYKKKSRTLVVVDEPLKVVTQKRTRSHMKHLKTMTAKSPKERRFSPWMLFCVVYNS